MCEPAEEIVLEPSFHWAKNDESINFMDALISSNCDHLKLFVNDGKEWQMVAESDADKQRFAHLKYPPFNIPLNRKVKAWGDLRIDGFIAGKQVISKSYSGKGVDQAFAVLPDETKLVADGADSVRVVLRVNDEFGRIRPFAADAIELRVEGPADIIGDNPFALVGGTGAIWLRTREQAGTVTLHAKHPVLGEQAVEFTLSEAPVEIA